MLGAALLSGPASAETDFGNPPDRNDSSSPGTNVQQRPDGRFDIGAPAMPVFDNLPLNQAVPSNSPQGNIGSGVAVPRNPNNPRCETTDNSTGLNSGSVNNTNSEYNKDVPALAVPQVQVSPESLAGQGINVLPICGPNP